MVFLITAQLAPFTSSPRPPLQPPALSKALPPPQIPDSPPPQPVKFQTSPVIKSPILPRLSRSLLPVVALTFSLPATWASESYPDDQDPMSPYFVGPFYPWVHYDANYGQPGRSAYKGVWRTPNNWPGKESPDGRASDVTIRHQVNLSNAAYSLGGPMNLSIVPFPGLQGGLP